MTADANLLDQYLALDTATVSDALDNCGLPPGQGGLRPMWGRRRIVGFAATVELEPLTGEHAGAHILTDAIAQAGPENVMVVANGGRIDVSRWGGIVSAGAAMRSIRGAVRRSGSTGPRALISGRLGKLPTAAISDALDREGIPGALEGLAPLSDDFRVAGPAFTIRYAPADSAAGTVGDFLDEVPPG